MPTATATTRTGREQLAPTGKQLALLRELCAKRHLPYQPPATRGEASARLDALLAPTPKQLRELRRLALDRGVTFTTPRTSQQASRQIQLLRSQTPSSRQERAADQRAVSALRSASVPERHRDDAPPTPRQLATLADLCAKRGLTFTAPETRTEASEQLTALLGRSPGRPRRYSDRSEERGLLPASSVQEDELVGWGPRATWR